MRTKASKASRIAKAKAANKASRIASKAKAASRIRIAESDAAKDKTTTGGHRAARCV